MTAIGRLLADAGLDRTLPDHGFRAEHLPRLVAGVTGNLANDPTADASARDAQLLSLYQRAMTPRPAAAPRPPALDTTDRQGEHDHMIDPPSNVAAHMTTELVGRPGSVFLVLSGPGGTGKSSLIRMWREADPDLGYVKNVTTRTRRAPDPVSGVDDDDFFEFVSREEFHRRVQAGELAQWVNPQEGYYSGTPLAPLREAVAQGRDLVFDYTPQLFLNLQRAFPEQVVGVFVAPPSLEVLRDRLAGRGSEDGAKLQLKFNMGAQDMAYVDMHDYHVTNVDLADTLTTLRSILVAEKARLRRSPNLREVYADLRDPRQMLFYYDPGYTRLATMAGS